MPENQRARYLAKNGADPALLQNWARSRAPISGRHSDLRGLGGDGAVAGGQVRTAGAARVRELYARRPCGTRLSPIVSKAFKGQSPGRIEEVADIYGTLLARTDPEWQAAMAPSWRLRSSPAAEAGAEPAPAAAQAERSARAHGAWRAGQGTRPRGHAEAGGLAHLRPRPG